MTRNIQTGVAGEVGSSARTTRDPYIDFLRGVVIIDMILIHYSPYLASPLAKVLNVSDIAMEGFLLVSGFMTGRHYLPGFVQRPERVTTALLTRAIKLTVVQYFLIFAASYPQFLLLRSEAHDMSPGTFLLDSLLFRNQVGLMHILPLFIALSIVSPILLFLVARNGDWLLIAGSVMIFWLGHTKPSWFIYGSPAIFPIALWQVYFLLGIWLGARAQRCSAYMIENTTRVFLVIPVLLAAVLVLKYGDHIGLPGTLGSHLPYVTRFPLT